MASRRSCSVPSGPRKLTPPPPPPAEYIGMLVRISVRATCWINFWGWGWGGSVWSWAQDHALSRIFGLLAWGQGERRGYTQLAYDQCSYFQFAELQIEGLKSQSHCLCSLQDALWKLRSPRGWARFSRLKLWNWKLAATTPRVTRLVQGPRRQNDPDSRRDDSTAPRNYSRVYIKKGGRVLWTKIRLPRIARQGTVCLISIRG